MCGIAGFCNKDINQIDVILKMNKQMYHRGPDAGGYFLDEDTGMTLGHRRLSIVDLSENGAQPMYSSDKRYVMIYNGEIYNASAIASELKQDGYVKQFRGTSDTEIILEACVAYGLKKTLAKCKGMFAIALYDRDTKTLKLTRDRVGEKPLYYGYVKGAFVFASDLAVIREYPDFHNELNKEAMAQFLRYGYVPAPLSIYQNIYKLLPGTILTLQYPYQNAETDTYWSMTDCVINGRKNPFTGSYEEAKAELDRKLKDAVASQMVADVPLGAFLSGGIDSSVVVSMMQSLNQKKTQTFTIGFEDEKFNEAQFAKDIANHLGTNHTELYVSEKELEDVVPKLSTIFSEPFADQSEIPTYLVSKLAREHVTVSLSGDAGDELFCGYNTYYKIDDLWNKINKIPYGLRNGFGAILTRMPLCMNETMYRSGNCLKAADILALQEAVCYDTTYYAKRMNQYMLSKQVSLYNGMLSGYQDKTEMMLYDLIHYHPDDILAKVDRAGMAVSLENRVPMLDKDVVEFAATLPIEYKYQNGNGKRILKDVLYQYVPKDLMDRPKKGFSVPLQKWLMQGNVHEWADEMIRNAHLGQCGILDNYIMQKAWTHFLKTGQNKGFVFNLAILEQWYRQYCE